MSPVKTLDELRIDTDILIIGIDNLCQNEEKLEAIAHLEESIKYLKDGIKRCQAVDVCATPPTEAEEEERSSDEDANSRNDGISKDQRPDASSPTEQEGRSSEDDVNLKVDPTKVKQPDTPPPTLSPHYNSQTHDLDKSAQPTIGEVQVTVHTINCPYCDFSTLSIHSLRAHMSRHTSQIKCEICDAYFARSCNLKRHKRGTLHKQRLKGIKRALESETDNNDSSSSSNQSPPSTGSQVESDCEMTGIKRLKRASVIVSNPGPSPSFSRDKLFEAVVSSPSPSFSHQTSSLDVDSGKIMKNLNARVDLGRLKDVLSKESIENLLNNNIKVEVSEVDGVLPSEPLPTSNPHPFTCEICFKSYSRKEYLTQHKVEHTTKYQCDNCLQTFSNMRRLRNHKKRPENCARLLVLRDKSQQKHTKPPSDVKESSPLIKDEIVIDVKGEAEVEEPSLICQKCGALVSSVEEMKDHLSQFHDVALIDGSHLDQHVKDEFDQDQDYDQDLQEVDVFHCDICDKFFSSKQSLRNHQVSHTDRFRCGSCHFGFSSKKFLELHTGNPDNCDRLRRKRLGTSEDNHLHVDASSFVMAVINDLNE